MTVVGLPRRAPQPSLQTSRSRRAAWLAMTLLALLVAATSAPYLSGDPGTFLDLQRETYLALLTPLMLHVGGAVVALALGPFQLLGRLRSRWPRVHRAVGRVYVLAVLATALGGLLLAPTTYTGWFAGLAFALLALGTLTSTAIAVLAIRRRQVAQHRVWMVRSYAFIFTGVSFRLGLVLLPALGLSFDTSYAVSAWIAWPANLAVAEVLLRRSRRSSPRPVPDQRSLTTAAAPGDDVVTRTASVPPVRGTASEPSADTSTEQAVPAGDAPR